MEAQHRELGRGEEGNSQNKEFMKKALWKPTTP